MTLGQYFRRAISLPPHILLLKIYQLALFRFNSYWIQIKDTLLTTYSSHNRNDEFTPLFKSAPNPFLIDEAFPELKALLEKTANHEFNLLASDWQKVFYGMKAPGINSVKYEMNGSIKPMPGSFEWINHLINFSNRASSKNVWKHISGSYQPIDWHIDFKSGYRWNSKTWWFRVPYGHKPGVDIKVPWELSRCQHMPWLALGFAMFKESKDMPKANELALEFQNTILDFIATNPPKYGVNWRCAMDVAFRASSWVLTYDFFRLYGWTPKKEIQNIIENSLYDHGEYIFSNLEIGKDGFRGNHYLADVCGLAFISSFLGVNKTTVKWLQFAHKALVEEMDYQFHDDGANFEGSTAYHKMSSEMMLYTTLVFENLPEKKKVNLPKQLFSTKYYQKLYSITQFSEHITRPDKRICQIGDNDSGRFFKIKPVFMDQSLEEDHLAQHDLISLIKAFFKNENKGLVEDWIYQNSNFNSTIELSKLPTSLNRLEKFKDILPLELNNYLEKVCVENQSSSIDKNFSQVEQSFPIPENVKPKLIIFERFGLYIWKDNNFFMSFRCGPVGQKERGGHDHNDQLSIELITPELKLEDPGTGIYTPFPTIRNKYRSASAHFGPQVFRKDGTQVEPGDLNQGLFSLNSDQGSSVIFANEKILVGFNKKLATLRIINLGQSKKLLIQDICLNYNFTLQLSSKNIPSYSRGYGFFEERKT